MKRWLKRIRGVVGMGLTWAAVWGGVGTIIGVVAVVFGLDPASGITVGAVIGAIVGFLAGATFSTVLGITEGRRRFDEMSLPRFALWGALGGLLVSGVLTALGASGIVLMYGGFPVLVAGCAAGSLALARKAGDEDLLKSGEGVRLLEGETPDSST